MKTTVAPNTLPIEYKKIEITDFDSTQFSVNKHILTPNPTTDYIDYTEIITKSGNIEDSNTTVLNLGLGLGKSYSLIKLIEEHLKDPNNIVMLSAPFHSLIKEYHTNITRNTSITSNQILTVDDIDNGVKFDLKTHRVHLMTTHLLLSTGIDKQVFPSTKRLDYLHDILTISKEKDKKIILIIDEIHDSVKLFNETNIQKLWRFKHLIKKTYCASATFSEVSKIVLRYLAELTDNKILIFENEREQRKDLSDLHLHFVSDTNEKSYQYVIERILNYTTTPVDIITSTITLAIKLKKTIDSSFPKKFNINICSSQHKDYDDSKLNIGTNFTTGNNIPHHDHELIIILPTSKSISFSNIYSEKGYIKLLQAIGRQRKKGKVHIIIDDALFIDSVKHNAFLKPIKKQIEDTGFIKSKHCKYSDINNENNLLMNTYNKWCTVFETATTQSDIKGRVKSNTTPLDVIHFEKFSFEYGDKYLREKFFCGSIGTFVLWAALFDQYTTCKLIDINIYETNVTFYSSKDIEFFFKKIKSETESSHRTKTLDDNELKELIKLKLKDYTFYDNKVKLPETTIDNLINSVVKDQKLYNSKKISKTLLINYIKNDIREQLTKEAEHEVISPIEFENTALKATKREKDKCELFLKKLEQLLISKIKSRIYAKKTYEETPSRSICDDTDFKEFIKIHSEEYQQYKSNRIQEKHNLSEFDILHSICSGIMEVNGFKEKRIKNNKYYYQRVTSQK